ncbi:hypothetical protein HDU98_008320 [Podochytrium sp. JEL0797]|nr:hypothetical protein HDU98_008320 [Podochytrium sp. JEL0797]
MRNPRRFYESLVDTYSTLALTKQPTPLAHHLVLHLESKHLLSRVYTTTVDGLLPGLGLPRDEVVLVGGDVVGEGVRCLKCGGVKEEEGGEGGGLQYASNESVVGVGGGKWSTERLFGRLIPEMLARKPPSAAARRGRGSVDGVDSVSNDASATIPCPRRGCVHGVLAPTVLLRGEDVDMWVDQRLGGWARVLDLEGVEVVVVVGVEEAEVVGGRVVREVLGRVGRGREVWVVEGGVGEGLRRLEGGAGWKWGGV